MQCAGAEQVDAPVHRSTDQGFAVLRSSGIVQRRGWGEAPTIAGDARHDMRCHHGAMSPIPTRARLRVAVVEDQPLYRAMLVQLLDADPRTVVAVEASGAAEARRRIMPGAVDVAILDIELGDGNGVGWRSWFDLGNPVHMEYVRRYVRYTWARYGAHWNVAWSIGSENGNLARINDERLPQAFLAPEIPAAWFQYWTDFLNRRDPYGRM